MSARMAIVISLVLAGALLAPVSATSDVPPYSDKCPTIHPLTSLNDTTVGGHWYLYATGGKPFFTCVKFHAVPISRDHYHTHGIVRALNGTVYKDDFYWEVKKSSGRPEGWLLDIHSGYYVRLVVWYILDMDKNGAAVTYMCMEQKDGSVREQVQVCTRTKSYNATRVEEVLKKNGLERLKVKQTYVDCPKEIEDF